MISQKHAVEEDRVPATAQIYSMTLHIKILNGKRWTGNLTRRDHVFMEVLIKWKGLKNLQ